MEESKKEIKWTTTTEDFEVANLRVFALVVRAVMIVHHYEKGSRLCTGCDI